MRTFNVPRLRAVAALTLVALGMSIVHPGVGRAQTGACTVAISGDGVPGAFTVTTGPGSVTFDAADGGTGLQSIQIVLGPPVNATVNIPNFTLGTTAPVTVTYTVIDPTKVADFTLQAQDAIPHTAIAAVHCAAVQACNPNTCVVTQGFWKTHPNDWPVTTLTLGTVTYTEAQLLTILSEPVRGNGLVSLSKQLIAAKLNIANGACVPAAVAAAITLADALIGGAIVPPVGSGFADPSATSALNTILDQYNNGQAPGGPRHCD